MPSFPNSNNLASTACARCLTASVMAEALTGILLESAFTLPSAATATK